MQWKAWPLLALGLILCMVGAGCSSSFGPTVGSLAINASALPVGAVGIPYSYSIPASGGTPPYIYMVAAGTLPAGLKLSLKGVISGIPVVGGTSSFTLQVTDSEAVPAGTTASLNLTIQGQLAVTSLSPPAGTVGVSYNTTLAAAGGILPYTWSLASGNLPPGLSLNSAGVISGTPTANGTSSFTVQVVDAESPPQAAPGQLSITINFITVTTQSLAGGTVNAAYSASLAAIGGVAPYTWTLASGTLPTGLSLSSAGDITGTPTAAGTSTFTVQVADSQQRTATARLSITVASSGSGTPPGTLRGNYAFYLNGFNSNGAWTLAGSFIAAANGNISNGVVDYNSAWGQPVTTAIYGTYNISPNGLNTMIIQGLGQPWGPMTLAFVLDSTGNGRMIEYDDNGSRGSGVLLAATPSAFSQAALNGGWVFGMTGRINDPSGERYVNVGQFALVTGNIPNIPSGYCYINDGGSYQTCGFTGTLSSVDPTSGRATVTLQTSTGTSTEAVYVVSATEMVMEEIDPVQQDSTPVQVGPVLQQSGSFNNGSLSGLVVAYYQSVTAGSSNDDSGAAIVSCDGNGSCDDNNNILDDDNAGTITSTSAQPSWGTDTVEANGAVTFNGGGDAPAGFLVSQNKGFMVSTGPDPVFYWFEPQTGGPFSNSSLAGSYAGGSLAPLDYSNGGNEVDVGTADGQGTFTMGYDSSDSRGLNQSLVNTVTYNIGINGRGTAQSQGDPMSGVVYMISPTRWLVLQPTTDARVEVYQH
jgi:hypothetical protein